VTLYNNHRSDTGIPPKPDSVVTPKDTSFLFNTTRAHFSHFINASTQSLPVTPFLRLNLEAQLQKHSYQFSPVSDTMKNFPKKTGNSLLYGAGAKPFIAFRKNDTLSLMISVVRNQVDRYDRSTLVLHHTRSELSFVYPLSIASWNATACGSIGYTFVKVNSLLESSPA
jgi:hypothetical protein